MESAASLSVPLTADVAWGKKLGTDQIGGISMPELPEVEQVRKTLLPHIKGKNHY